MDDAELTRRVFAGLGAFHRLLGEHVAGARVIEGDGWVGSHVPASPHSAIVNSVSPAEPRKLVEALGHIEGLYGPRQKWGVWCDRRDGRTEAALEAAGLVLDSRPIGQGAALQDIAGLDDTDGAEPVDLLTVGRVNEAAYGLKDGRFVRIFSQMGDSGLVAFGVQDAAVACYHPHGDDAHVCFVATHPDHRRRGLATAAVRGALRHAREAGCTTTTLEGSPKGVGVYRAMGYRDLCPIALWEKRPG